MSSESIPACSATSPWTWLRVYYFEDSKDDLIREAVWPAIGAASTETGRGFYQRDWLNGPNIFIGLHGSAANEVSKNRVVEILTSYLTRCPSKRQLSPAAFQQSMKKMAVLESRSVKVTELQPNNSIASNCPEPTTPMLRPGELQERVRRFLCHSSGLVANWLDLIREGRITREELTLRALIGLAWVACPAKLRCYISYRSHANGFLRAADVDGDLLGSLARRYAGVDGSTVRRLLRDSVEKFPHGTVDIPLMDEYISLMSHALGDVHEGLASGRYQAVPLQQFASKVAFGSGLLSADVHRRLFLLIESSPLLRAWQITANLVYLLLNQLGVGFLQRSIACYLVARAVEDEYGESVAEIATHVADTGNPEEMLSFFGNRDHLTVYA